MTAGSNGQGRIHPHQRNANITGTILGDSILLDEHYIEGLQVVEAHGIEIKSKHNHHNCIKHIYTFWEEYFSECNEIGVKFLSADKLNNRTKYYWKNRKDLVYEGLSSKFLKAFLSTRTVPHGLLQHGLNNSSL